MEKTNAEKFKLGIFVIIGLVLFVTAVYFIGNKKNMFGKTTTISALFNNVNGLQLGNNVRYAGINIGTVTTIEMLNDTVIKVEMSIENKILPHIKKDAIAAISSDGLVGNMIINIIPGKGISAPIQPNDIIQSFNKVRTEDMLKTLSVTNENAAILTSDLIKITKEISAGKGTVGLLLNDADVAQDLKETIHYLKMTSQGTTSSIENLNKIITSLNQKNNLIGVVNDTMVASKIKSIVINLEKSSKKIDLVVDNLNTTIDNAKNGKGVINYLSNDPKLVQKIDSTMININEASIRLNQNLEALKHNFFFRGYFKKQAKAKAKTTTK